MPPIVVEEVNRETEIVQQANNKAKTARGEPSRMSKEGI